MDSKEDCKKENAKIEFEKSLQLRNFEIDNFWKRGWFFGALLLSMFAAYYQVKAMSNPIVPSILMAFLISLIAFFQCLMNRGSKYWQERWEYKTKNRESMLGIDVTTTKKFNQSERYYIDASILAKGENRFTRSRRISVSKLTFLIWDLITLFSVFVWINEIIENFSIHPDLKYSVKVIGFHLISFVYIYIFFKNGLVTDKLKKSKQEVAGDQNHNNYYEDSEDYVLNRIKNE